MVPTFKADYSIKTKPKSLGRVRQKIAFLLLVAAVIALSTTMYSKLTNYLFSTDLSLAKHYIDKGACPGIGISNAKLKTKFSDGKVFYILKLSVAKGKETKLPRSFTVKISDKDGFDVQYFTINSSNFTVELDESEKFTGYSYQSAQYIDAEKYKSVANWNLTWSLK